MDNKGAGPGTPEGSKAERFSRLEEICHQALERPEEEMPLLPARACAGDVDLRREVEKLLSFDRKAGRLMESPALRVAARPLVKTGDSTESMDFVGRDDPSLHEVRNKIGEGGMGVVYCAEDTILRSQVAIKMLPGIFAGDPDRLAHFEREARLLASLNHPNICSVAGRKHTGL